MHRLFTLLPTLLVVAILAGCAAPNASNRQYSASSLNMSARTIEAVVVSKRSVTVSGTSSVGGTSGAVVGGVAGSGLGRGTRGNIVGAVAGVVVGGIAGAAIEASATQQEAFEYIVKSDVTGLMTLIQSDGDIEVGDAVFLVLATKPVLVRNQSTVK